MRIKNQEEDIKHHMGSTAAQKHLVFSAHL